MWNFWAMRTLGRTPRIRKKIKTLKNFISELRSAAPGKGELQQGQIGTNTESRRAGASTELINMDNESLINQQH